MKFVIFFDPPFLSDFFTAKTLHINICQAGELTREQKLRAEKMEMKLCSQEAAAYGNPARQVVEVAEENKDIMLAVGGREV